MPHPLEAGTIRILKPDGSTAGTGFLVSKRLAVTCAHVIESAGVKPGEIIEFKYHLGDLDLQRSKVLENGWSIENDIAILELTGKPPKWIHPIIMQSSRAMEGRVFQGLGYPDDGPVQTRWPQGNISGRVDVDGYAHPLLQLQGREIDKGLSGSAVVDRATRRVIGMITAYQDIKRPRDADNVRFGYAIPMETIWKVYSELEKELPPLPKRSPLVEGIHLLPHGYDFRIQNFLTEYLGTPEQPEPFGGREDALKKLDEWLDGDTQRLLLAAPAGRGKSALLVRWLNRLIFRDDLALVFVPISVRFRTNLSSTFFASLGARLAYLHGEDVPISDTTSIDVWHGLVSTYLTKPLTDERKLLIVLDGLDEAGDWEASADLIPAELPKNVRVVVSARYLAEDSDGDSWLSRLGWEHTNKTSRIELDPLNANGVSDILFRMGVPLDKLSQRVDIVSELHRLSEGDPLLVNLYVEDLWSRGEEVSKLQPEDLKTITPGYEGYFERWWADQKKLWGEESPLREKNIRLVFNLLCSAMGGLTNDDLVALDTENVLNIFAIEEALTALKRFVIGIPDEHVKKGISYVLTHPKLRDYFWDKLTEKEQSNLDNSFLVWGERIVQALVNAKLQPSNTPRYLLHYYSAHLVRANAPAEKFMAFVKYPQWHQAWFAYEGAYGGYLQDVRRTWIVCDKKNQEIMDETTQMQWIGDVFRFSLIESSTHSLATNISPELLGLLVEDNILTLRQAFLSILQISKEDQQAEALGRIAAFLSGYFLEEALAITYAMAGEKVQSRALIELAPFLSDDNRVKVVNKIWGYEDDETRLSALIKYSEYMPAKNKDDLLDDILDHTRTLQDARLRNEILFKIAPMLKLEAKISVLTETLNFARNSNNNELRVRILCELTPYLSRESQIKASDEMLQVAVVLIRKEKKLEPLKNLITNIMSHIPNDLRTKSVNSLLSVATHEGNIVLLCSLAPYLPHELRKQALEAVYRVSKLDIIIFIDYFGADLSYNQMAEMLQIAKSFNYTDVHEPLIHDVKATSYLRGLGPYLPVELLAEAFQIACEIRDEHWRSQSLIALIPYLTDPLRSKLIEITDRVHDPKSKANILINLVPFLSGNVLFYALTNALIAVRSIKYASSRAQALAGLATYVSVDLRLTLLREALNSSRIVSDENAQAVILRKFVQFLIGNFKDEAIEILHNIEMWNEQINNFRFGSPSSSWLSGAHYIVSMIRESSQENEVEEKIKSHLPGALRNKVDKSSSVTAELDHNLTYPMNNLENILLTWKEAGFEGFDGNAWSMILRELALYDRSTLLRILAALLPTIQHFNDQETVTEIYLAVRDVTIWWP